VAFPDTRLRLSLKSVIGFSSLSGLRNVQLPLYGGFAWGTFECAGCLRMSTGLLTRDEAATPYSFSSEHPVA
jgi:hypothetical protein